MPVHHLRMLDQHRANYNKQDTVLAQLLYHLNTVHIIASVSRVGTTLVNAYNSFHLYIIMSFFRLTPQINPSCQTDADKQIKT